MIKVIRITSILLVLCILCSTTAFAAEQPSLVQPDSTTLSETDQKRERLFDERAEILCQMFAQEKTRSENALLYELNRKDIELTCLGVSFLTTEEVKDFLDSQAVVAEKSSLSQNGIQPRADIIDSAVNTWTTYRTTYVSGSDRFEIQCLTAQPIPNYNSPLANLGTRTITFNKNWAAGAINVLETAARTLADGMLEKIPGATMVLSLLDAIYAFATGINTTTEVKVPHITYTWTNVTTAVFSYVKRSGQSDAQQILSLVSTKTNTLAQYTIPKFSYNGSETTPEIISGQRSIIATPPNYNSSALAVYAYSNIGGGPLQNCVSSIQISGPESRLVQSIAPCYPSFPYQCEF